MSSTDVIILLTSDGQEWGTYISDRLSGFADVTFSTVDLSVLTDVRRDRVPEPTLSAWQQSSVAVLLISPMMLTLLEKNAGWMAPTLRDLSPTTSVVALTFVGRKDLDDVTKRHGYVTSEWKFQEPGITSAEVQQKIAEVLDLVDHNRQAGRARLLSSSSSPKVVVELFPSVVFERNTRVAVVFREEVHGEVTVKLEQTDIPLKAVRETPSVFTFIAPHKASGRYSVRVYTEGKRQRGRLELTYRGVQEAAFTSPRFLAQALRLQGDQALDLRLRDIFTRSLPPDHGLDVMFRSLPPLDSVELQKNADSPYPTLLHYAAAWGLSEFCAALLDCPGSARAFYIRNCDGLDPAELAAENEFYELEDYILDFMELQTAATQNNGIDYKAATYMTPDQTNDDNYMAPSEKNDGDSGDSYYMEMSGCPTNNESQQESLYSNPLKAPYPPGPSRLQKSPPPTIPTTSPATPPPPSTGYWTMGSVSASSLFPSTTITTTTPTTTTTSRPPSSSSSPSSSSPPFPDCPTSSVYSTVFPSSLTPSVQRSLPPSAGLRDGRPPAPLPAQCGQRARSTPDPIPRSPEKEDLQDRTRACSMPEASRQDPAAFMGMGGSQAAGPAVELPAGAMGSRSQGELIEVQELVKSQEITQGDAQRLFKGWQQRFGRNTAVSFKDRQKGLQTIKAEFQKRSQEPVSRSDSCNCGPRSIFSRFIFGGRQKKKTDFKINISEPVLSPGVQKIPYKVYTRTRSDSQLTTRDNTRSSDRDSAYYSVIDSPLDSDLSHQLRQNGASTIGRERPGAMMSEEPVPGTRSKSASRMKGGRFLSDGHLPRTAPERDSACSVDTYASAMSQDSGCSHQLRHSTVSSQGGRLSAVSSKGDPDAEVEEDDVFGSEDVIRRSHQRDLTATMNRMSLGDMFLQQALRGQTGGIGRTLPPLPVICPPGLPEKSPATPHYAQDRDQDQDEVQATRL